MCKIIQKSFEIINKSWHTLWPVNKTFYFLYSYTKHCQKFCVTALLRFWCARSFRNLLRSLTNHDILCDQSTKLFIFYTLTQKIVWSSALHRFCVFGVQDHSEIFWDHQQIMTCSVNFSQQNFFFFILFLFNPKEWVTVIEHSCRMAKNLFQRALVVS